MKYIIQTEQKNLFRKNYIHSIWEAAFLGNEEIFFEGNKLVANLNELVKIIKYESQINSLKKNLHNYGFTCRLRCRKSADKIHIIFPNTDEMQKIWNKKSKRNKIFSNFLRPKPKTKCLDNKLKKKIKRDSVNEKQDFDWFNETLASDNFDLLENIKSKDKEIEVLKYKNAKLSKEVANLQEQNDELKINYLLEGKTSIENSRLVKEKFKLRQKEFAFNRKKKVEKIKKDREKTLIEQELFSELEREQNEWNFNSDIDFGPGQIYSMCLELNEF